MEYFIGPHHQLILDYKRQGWKWNAFERWVDLFFSHPYHWMTLARGQTFITLRRDGHNYYYVLEGAEQSVFTPSVLMLSGRLCLCIRQVVSLIRGDSELPVTTMVYRTEDYKSYGYIPGELPVE